MNLALPLQLHTPNQRHGQKHRRNISNHINRGRARRRDERVQARPRRRRVPGFVDRRAFEDGHEYLRDAVTGDDTSDDPAGDRELFVGVKDAAVK